MGITNSINMSLPVPGVGTEAGPDYALDINSCLTLIDLHDHSPGNGVQITPPGININAALSFNNQNLTAINSALFTAQTVATSSLQALSVAPGSESPPVQDLWYTDSNGTKIQITDNGQLAAVPTSVVGISYAAGTFFFKQTPDTSTAPANLDAGSVIIRPNVALTSLGVVLSPPASIATQYPIQLPPLPVANSFVTLDNSGNMATAGAVANGLTRSNLAVGAFGVQSVATVSGAYVALTTDDVILTSSGSVTLYTAVGASGRLITIKRTTTSLGSSITVAGHAAETIDGSNTTTLSTQYESIQLMSDGTGWQLIERTIPSTLTSYAATLSAPFNAGAISYYWRRSGNFLEVYGTHMNGTVTAGIGSITLPSGLAIDTTKLPFASNTTAGAGTLIGQFTSNAGGGSAVATVVTAAATAVDRVYLGGLYSQAGMLVPTANTATIIGNNNIQSSLFFRVPIVGWAG